MKNEKRFPIKIVAQRTGLTVHAIRVWEKRYNIVTPFRTETNRRLYSEKDIELLGLMFRATQSGYSIGSVADLDADTLKEMLGAAKEVSSAESSQPQMVTPTGSTKLYLDESLSAIINFDSNTLERILLRASIDLTQPALLQELIVPLLEKVGELWHEGTIRIMHEHLATAVISPFLANLRNAYRPVINAPTIVIATPLGQIHDLGALIIAVVAASVGWRVVYLGSNLPAEEVAAAALKERSKVVALSIIYPFDDPLLRQELLKLRSLLDPHVSIIIGGRGYIHYNDIFDQIEAKGVGSIQEFKSHLSNLAEIS